MATLDPLLRAVVDHGMPKGAYLEAVDKDDLSNRYRTEGIDVGFLDHLDDE